MAERIWWSVDKTLLDLLYGVGEVQVKDGTLELEPDKVWHLEGVVGFEKGPFVNPIVQDNSQMSLDCLQEERNMYVCVATLESQHSKVVFAVIIRPFPQISCRFWNAEKHIQETDDPSMLNLVLPLLCGYSFGLHSDTALDIKPKVNLKGTG